ncbi:TPA: HNH endonuclease [Citrobacter pasteurii]|nr:HNH endonuclease [Citrobacter pasteurii]HEF0065110.1 HNH endonuclease [Citrobacter pasteurii]
MARKNRNKKLKTIVAAQRANKASYMKVYNRRMEAFGKQAKALMSSLGMNYQAFMGEHILNIVLLEMERGHDVANIRQTVEKSPFAEQYRNHQEYLKTLSESHRRAINRPEPRSIARKSTPHMQPRMLTINSELMSTAGLTPTKTIEPRHVSPEPVTFNKNTNIDTPNPRTYDLPNLPVNAPGMNTDRMTEARALAGIHFPDFLKYHIKNKGNGLDAYRQAKRFMAEFYPATLPSSPVNVLEEPSGAQIEPEENVKLAAEPVKRSWTKEEKQEARAKAQAAARSAREQNNPQHIIDPVIVNGIEYRSTWHAMQTLKIGEDADARRFRREVKAKGEDIWTHDGEQFRFELKNKRPEQVEAIQKEELELLDVELKASGRVAEVFQRDPRAQSVFRKLVLENFGERCAVTGKHLNGVLEAAHIEGAALDGCYNASTGVLLSPTFHKLYDRHMMGINPETMTVHFAPGIEWEEYEGKVIMPLRYRLDKDRLATRWKQFEGKKGN